MRAQIALPIYEIPRTISKINVASINATLFITVRAMTQTTVLISLKITHTAKEWIVRTQKRANLFARDVSGLKTKKILKKLWNNITDFQNGISFSRL